MRKLVSGLFYSLDGVVENPEWTFPYWSDEMGEELTAIISKQDTVLLGRVSYEEWAGYWPTAETDKEFADFINNVPKIVVSSTLEKTEWQNSTLLKGDLVEGVTKLKQQPGGDIGVQASPTLVEALIAHGLLDELHLYVHPVIVGKGRKLFLDSTPQTPLKLLKSRATTLGVMCLTYGLERAG
jgi:dihydrofolate reductase